MFYVSNQLVLPGRDYILQSQTLTFTFDEFTNTSSTPCVNVTILDDNIPENELYITIGLSVASIDNRGVIIIPGRNQTTIAILDDDHGMFIYFLVVCKLSVHQITFTVVSLELC